MTLSAEAQLHHLLKRDGATLIRSGKHPVYKLSTGQSFTIPKTPSDRRSYPNSLADLRRILGVKREASKSAAPRTHTKHSQPTAPEPVALTPRDERIDRQNFASLAALASVLPQPESQPIRRSEPKHTEQAPAYTYPTAVLSEATRILNEQGKPAMDAYLAQHRSEAVTIMRSRKTKPEVKEMPSVLELRVAGARDLRTRLQSRIAKCGVDIENAEKVIETAKSDRTSAEGELSQVNQFLEWYDSAVQASESVEPLLTAFQQLAITEARYTEANTRTPQSPYSPTKLLNMAVELWEPDGASINAQDLFEFFRRKGIDVPKRTFYGVLQQGEKSFLEKTPGRPGEYRRKLAPQHQQSQQQQHSTSAVAMAV